MLINSQIKINEESNFSSDWSKEEISAEPMFYRSSLKFAVNNGGPITRNFLLHLPSSWFNEPNLTIDSRVHMLMPGWYPCIPGWHHDDIPRTRSDGQPNYEQMDYQAEHLMGLVNAEVAPTQFALGEVDYDIPEVGKIIYKEWHEEVERSVSRGHLTTLDVESGKYYEFNNMSFHQGTSAVQSGWRWFCRVSRNTKRALEPKNEIRKQVQVYMKNPMEGW